MKTIILSWNGGDSDAFTSISRAWAEMLRRHGKNVVIVELSDPEWATRLFRLAEEGIDFVLTFQGLSTTATIKKNKKLVWDQLRVPLICIQGDHPSYTPEYQQLERDYCFHLCTEADFARYSNTHFRKKYPALFFHPPQMFYEEPLQATDEETFVLIKNIRHPLDIEQEWRDRLSEHLQGVFMEAAGMLKDRLQRGGYFEMHDALDELIATRNWYWMSEAENPGLLHQFHGNLDYYVRSHKAVCVLEAMRDLPLQVYGRGWERCKAGASRHWSFHDGLDMVSTQRLFYTRYGIVDVSAAKGLHDRSFRAMVNRRGFLSSGYIKEDFDGVEGFEPLFYDFRPGLLQERCAAVMQDPEGHRERALAFADFYHERIHGRYLVPRLDALAMSVHRGAGAGSAG